MRGVRWLVSATRYFVVIPVAGSILAAIVLTVFGTVAVVNMSVDTVEKMLPVGEITAHDVEHTALDFIKLIDIYLLGTVLYIIGIGLYQLFLASDLELPDWLRTDDLDELKGKLIGVVVVLIGVTFLGEAMSWDGSSSILALGVGSAAVIAALAVVFAVMPHKHPSPGRQHAAEPGPHPAPESSTAQPPAATP